MINVNLTEKELRELIHYHNVKLAQADAQGLIEEVKQISERIFDLASFSDGLSICN